MAGNELHRLGLVVRSGPLAGRSNRDQLDVALAAAALGIELHLYFTGAGLWQVAAGRDGQAAGLPSQPRAWLSLAEMTRVRAWAEESTLRALRAAGWEPVMDLEPAGPSDLQAAQAECDRVLVL